MKYLHSSALDFGPSSPLSTYMCAFGLPPFSLYDAYIKPPYQPSPPKHKLICYHHLTYDAFKYLPIKSYQLLFQLKKNGEQEKNIASCFSYNVYKKHWEFLPMHQYLVGNFLVSWQASRTVRNFPAFLTLDFPLLLSSLGNRLKFHINLVQVLKDSWMGF